MKIEYEKVDDTVQYLNNDKTPDWEPSQERLIVEIVDDQLTITTHHQNGLVATMEMSVVERNNGRLIAQHFNAHMGMTVFIHNPNESSEATLTLANHNYIVGRYLKRVESH